MPDEQNPVTGRTLSRGTESERLRFQKKIVGRAGWRKAQEAIAAVRDDVVKVHGEKSAFYSNQDLARSLDKSLIRTKFGATLQRRADENQQKRNYVNPEIYTTREEQEDWNNAFRESGANAFITPDAHGAINRTKGDTANGRAFQGWGQNTNFVGTQKQARGALKNAIQRAQITGKAENAIKSFDETYATNWSRTDQDQTMYQYRIGAGDLEHWGLRQPSGSEAGAYKNDWIAGGKTRGGAFEGTVKAVSREKLHEEVRDGRIAIHKRDFNRRGRGHLAPQTHEVLRAGATESDARAKAARPIPRVRAAVRRFFLGNSSRKKSSDST